jgi:hypothetical protein
MLRKLKVNVVLNSLLCLGVDHTTENIGTGLPVGEHNQLTDGQAGGQAHDAALWEDDHSARFLVQRRERLVCA